MSYSENPYESFTAAVVAQESADVRADFLTKTYLHLLGAVAGFVGLEVVYFQTGVARSMFELVAGIGGVGWIGVLLAFMIVSWVAQRMAINAVSVSTQYAGLALYVVAESLIFCPILLLAVVLEQGGADILGPAALITMLLFGGLTATVFLTRRDFSFLRGFLMFASFAAFVAILTALAVGFPLGIWFAVGMIILMCGWILYQTSEILHHYPVGMHVAASLALFASLATLFWYVLRLVIALQSRD